MKDFAYSVAVIRVLAVCLTLSFLGVVAGCGYTASSAAGLAIPLAGTVHSGDQPVIGSTVQLYAAGISGAGSEAHPLLLEPVKSDSNGDFSIPGFYRCPSASSQIYIVARGGKAGASSAGDNPALGLAAMLGSCTNLSSFGHIAVNEVTTIGSVWPLASYMKSPTHLGSAPDDPSFLAAISTVPEFVSLAQGSSPGTEAGSSYFAQSAKLYSLANVLANCDNSSGGSAGDDGSPCGPLFSMATPPGGSAPTDTISAAIRIAQNPDNNVTGIFSLLPAEKAFQPTLTVAPANWALTLSQTVAAPILSLNSGTYSGTQEVAISDSTAGSTIYYTTDGTVPTSSSLTYTQPIPIAVTTTLQAIAILQQSQSAVASSTLTITSPNAPVKLAFLQQPSNAMTQATISPAVQVAVEDSNGNPVPTAINPVIVALIGGTGLGGTLTAIPRNGVATFSNLAVNTAGGGYTLSATSPGLASAASASFTVSSPNSGTPAPPVKLAFLQQPSNTLIQATISPAVQVAVEDSNGNPVPTAINPVALALVDGTGLGGTLTAIPQNGVATFSNLTVNTAGSGYTLSATSSGLASAASITFAVSSTLNAPPTPAQAADAFVDSVGVNVHFGYYGTSYTSQTPQLISYLGQLNVRHVRDSMVWQGTATSSPFYQVHDQLGTMGIKTDYILLSPSFPMSQVAAYPSLVNDLEAVEPANEYDASGDPNWAQTITQQETDLYNQIHGSAETQNITVIAPSLEQPQNASQLGNISAIADVGNTHAYFGGWNPGNAGTGGEANPTYYINLALVDVPAKPVWMTETGYWSVQAPYYGGDGVGEALMATYTPRLLFQSWLAGASRTYIYELADESSTSFFGLIRNDGSAKPAFYAVSNLLALLNDPGAAFTPGSLSYALSGASPQVHQLLFQKRDGSYYLALWVEAAGMNGASLQTTAVPSQTVQILLGQFPAAVTSYQWSSAGTITTTTLSASQAISVSVGPNITVLKIQ